MKYITHNKNNYKYTIFICKQCMYSNIFLHF